MPETPQARQATDIFIVEEKNGDCIQFKTYPSPAIIRPGATEIRFRNFCKSAAEIDLKGVPVQQSSLTAAAGGATVAVSLDAKARSGFYYYTVSLPEYGVQAIGGSSPKVIIDI